MKKITILVLSVVMVGLFTTSCQKDEDLAPDFTKDLLIGTWKSNTLYEKYNSAGTGSTWDTADDVTEAEGQKFTWTLIKDDLEQIHIMETGGKVPKQYKVNTLTTTTLKYTDNYGVSRSFTKVK